MFTKNSGFWMMVLGGGASLYDLMTTKEGAVAGDLYGPGKPLESFRFKVYTKPATTTAPITPAKDYYVSISDAAAIFGAYLYFR